MGQDEDLARNLQIGCNGADCIALRHNRALVSPWRRVGDAHGRKQTPLTIGQLRIAAGLRRRGVTAARRKHHRCKEKRIFHVRSPARREAKPNQTAASIRMTLMAERIRPVGMLAQASLARSEEHTYELQALKR